MGPGRSPLDPVGHPGASHLRDGPGRSRRADPAPAGAGRRRAGPHDEPAAGGAGRDRPRRAAAVGLLDHRPGRPDRSRLPDRDPRRPATAAGPLDPGGVRRAVVVGAGRRRAADPGRAAAPARGRVVPAPALRRRARCRTAVPCSHVGPATQPARHHHGGVRTRRAVAGRPHRLDRPDQPRTVRHRRSRCGGRRQPPGRGARRPVPGAARRRCRRARDVRGPRAAGLTGPGAVPPGHHPGPGRVDVELLPQPDVREVGDPGHGRPAGAVGPVQPRRRRQPVPVLRRCARRCGGGRGEPPAAPPRAGMAGRARQRVGGRGARRLARPHPPRRLRRQRRAGRRRRRAARRRPQWRERRYLCTVTQLRGVQHGRRRRSHLGVGSDHRRRRPALRASTS